MRFIRIALLAVLLAICARGAQATKVEDLYEAETLVTGMAEPERTRGFRLGLIDVFVKLTGDARLLDGVELRPLLDDPRGLVESFDYEDRMKDIPVHDEQGTRDRPYFLRMRFKPESIDRELARLRLAKWSSERPGTAVWLAIKTDAGSFVLSRTGPEGYGQRLALVETARRRGIPIELPSPQDTSATTFADIASNDEKRISGVSAGAPAVLVGLLSLTPDGTWDISWRLRWQGQAKAWGETGLSFDAAFRGGLQMLGLIFSGHAPM